jgi:hypothetical protein
MRWAIVGTLGVLSGLLLLVLLLRTATRAEPPVPRLPDLPDSWTCGPAQAPEGGRVTVGLPVPAGPAELVVGLAPGEHRTFTVPFAPRYALEVVTAPPRAHEYYVPEEAARVAPSRVRAC